MIFKFDIVDTILFKFLKSILKKNNFFTIKLIFYFYKIKKYLMLMNISSFEKNIFVFVQKAGNIYQILYIYSICVFFFDVFCISSELKDHNY